jgi:hypothetical protein
MSSRAVDAANTLVDQIDSGELHPSRELMESIAEVAGALARWHRRQGKTLSIVRELKQESNQ